MQTSSGRGVITCLSRQASLAKRCSPPHHFHLVLNCFFLELLQDNLTETPALRRILQNGNRELEEQAGSKHKSIAVVRKRKRKKKKKTQENSRRSIYGIKPLTCLTSLQLDMQTSHVLMRSLLLNVTLVRLRWGEAHMAVSYVECNTLIIMDDCSARTRAR